MTEQSSNARIVIESLIPLSYDWTLNRVNALDARIQHLVIFSSGVTLGFPLLAERASGQPDYSSPLLWIALGLFVVQALLAYCSHGSMSVRLLDLEIVRDKSNSLNSEEFTAGLISAAVSHYNINHRRIVCLGWYISGIGLSFLGEMIFLLTWLAVA